MKNATLRFLFIVLSFSMLTAFTFNNSLTDPKGIEIKLDESSNQGNWGPWKETDCYKGLDFRVKNNGKNYEGKHKWSVQFQNRYYDKIYFSYEVYNNRPYSPRTTNRTDLDHNEKSSGYRDFYMQNGSSIYVHVDKVRFTKDGYQSYYSCDK